MRGSVEEAKEGGVAKDHGEEGAGEGEVEVAAAATEDAERKEMVRLGEEESREFASEAEVAVGGGVLVEGWVAD